MKKYERIAVFFSFVMVFIFLLPVQIYAKAKNSYVSKEPCIKDEPYSHLNEKYDDVSKIRVEYGETDYVYIVLDNQNYKIKNVKSDNSKMKLHVEKEKNHFYLASEKEKKYINTQYDIKITTRKQGTYTMSYQVVDGKGKVVENRKIKVYAYEDYPFKNITIDGKDYVYRWFNGVDKKKFNVKFHMNKGYKITKIKYSGSNKTFKNGSKFAVKDQGLQVFYIDKYTKNEESIYIYFQLKQYQYK